MPYGTATAGGSHSCVALFPVALGYYTIHTGGHKALNSQLLQAKQYRSHQLFGMRACFYRLLFLHGLHGEKKWELISSTSLAGRCRWLWG